MTPSASNPAGSARAPLRRRLRARLVPGLAGVLCRLPTPAVTPLLRAAGVCARGSRAAAIARQQLAATAPIAGWDAAVVRALERGVELHAVDQLAQVLRLAGGGGRIVNITSRGAYRGEPIKPAYGASKAGLTSLSQSLAVALAPHKIFVGAVAPGFVNTELTADRLASAEGAEIKAQSGFNRVAEPKEVAHAVLFLASEGAEFSTGTVIDVNGASYLR